ncbi:hypothetical protein ALQ07_103081 [Pseudomonas syringae pv. actinidiae]|uniref:Uncharacterized protein n=1 Tax=Pseudomonas syringae pv. actinidiae TaxID=103796 RepID=A0A3M4KLC6_PSESF|nr:hypothetical protein ALQ07_103081 [Pseudomonas syringae pv. actinidiae]
MADRYEACGLKAVDQLEFAVGRACRIQVSAAFAVLVLGADFIAYLKLLFRIQNTAIPGLGVFAVVREAPLEILDDDLSVGLLGCQVPDDRTHGNVHAVTSFFRWAFRSPV